MLAISRYIHKVVKEMKPLIIKYKFISTYIRTYSNKNNSLAVYLFLLVLKRLTVQKDSITTTTSIKGLDLALRPYNLL